jgi:hypothetical protein
VTPLMTPVDKRNFYLALSILEGQRIASAAGFSAPSQEVQESEIMDTIRKWLILTALGIFENIKDCAELMMEVVKSTNDLTDEELDSTETALVSFGMGLIAHLVDSDMLSLVSESDELEMDPKAAQSFIMMLRNMTEDDDE